MSQSPQPTIHSWRKIPRTQRELHSQSCYPPTTTKVTPNHGHQFPFVSAEEESPPPFPPPSRLSQYDMEDSYDRNYDGFPRLPVEHVEQEEIQAQGDHRVHLDPPYDVQRMEILSRNDHQLLNHSLQPHYLKQNHLISHHSNSNISVAPNYSNGVQQDGGDDLSFSSCDSNVAQDEISIQDVLERIEDFMISIILEPLDRLEPPQLCGTLTSTSTTTAVEGVNKPKKSFRHLAQCRSLTSLALVSSFCHALLLSNRTTTTREVYYYYVTHFRNQAECDGSIWELASTLQVPRRSLGLMGSPKGWFCGSIELYHRETGDLVVNARNLDLHGMAITTQKERNYSVASDARCILVIEKEGVYTRLSEDRFWEDYPCILVTGKGFPDVATRQWVQHLQHVLRIPAYGLCDCNPFGISVLNTYRYDQKGGTNNRRNTTHNNNNQNHIYNARATKHLSKPNTLEEDDDCECDVAPPQKERKRKRSNRRNHHHHPHHRRRHHRGLQLQWMGLRPSQLDALELPPTVFQQLTDQDRKRLSSLLQETHPFHSYPAKDDESDGADDKHDNVDNDDDDDRNLILRKQELESMDKKVELEALNWKGMNFLSKWVLNLLNCHDQERRSGTNKFQYII